MPNFGWHNPWGTFTAFHLQYHLGFWQLLYEVASRRSLAENQRLLARKGGGADNVVQERWVSTVEHHE